MCFKVCFKNKNSREMGDKSLFGGVEENRTPVQYTLLYNIYKFSQIYSRCITDFDTSIIATNSTKNS